MLEVDFFTADPLLDLDVTTVGEFKSKTNTQTELNELLAYTVRNTGKKLIKCLEEITPYLRYMDKNHSSLIAQIIKMRLADQSEDVTHSFQKFMFSFLSQNYSQD